MVIASDSKRPGLMRSAATDYRRGTDRRSFRRPWCLAAHRAVLRGHRPLAGRGAHVSRVSTCRGWRSACMPPAPPLPCSSPRRSAGLSAPGDPVKSRAVFLPSVPTLLLLGQRIGGAAQSRSRTTGSGDDELAERSDVVRTSLPSSRITLSRWAPDAELDQVIFDGSSFGTATPAGSDEEADYLGIPGFWIRADARLAAPPPGTSSSTARAAVSEAGHPARTTA